MSTDSPNGSESQAVAGQDAQGGASSASEQPNQQQQQDDNQQAASSTATPGDKGPKSALEAVERALAADKTAAADSAKREQDAAGAAPGTGKEGSQAGDGKDGKPDPAATRDDERFDKHPRFIELRGKVKAAEERAKQFEGKAQQFDQLQAWISEAGLTAHQLSPFLQVARLSVMDPETGLEAARRIVADLERAVGDVLPQDLRERVASGAIDEDTARELSRTRSREARLRAEADARASAERGAAEQQEAAEQQKQLGLKVGEAVSAWERTWKNSDPDYEKLMPLVWKEIKSMWVDEGRPSTPEQAVDQAKRARDNVLADRRALMPALTNLNPPTGGTPTRTKPVIKSTLDAVNAGLAMSAGG